jgi:heat-inducible transcriptional repressor
MKDTKQQGSDDSGPGKREAEILKSVIREHILSGEPIGSQTVSKARKLDLSPATIRNVMAALEDRGWLQQPHKSAGRVPTDQAYRWYVDRVVGVARIAQSQTDQIDRAMAGNCGEIADLLAEASRQLSHFSHHVGLVMAPQIDQIVVEHVEFVRIEPRRVVAIVVGRSGVVHNRILDLPEPIEQGDLDRAGGYLSEEFHGRTLDEIRELLRIRLSEERAAYDRLVAASLDLGRRAVEAESPVDVFVNGTSNLLGSPEFVDPEKIKSLMQALERKRTLIDLLGRVMEDQRVQVVIGDPQASPGLADCSLVASTYGTPDRVMGRLGIVGPKRMEYARAIALVDYLAVVLGRFFSSPGFDGGQLKDQVF